MTDTRLKTYQVMEGATKDYWVVVDIHSFGYVGEFYTAAEAQELADELNGELE